MTDRRRTGKESGRFTQARRRLAAEAACACIVAAVSLTVGLSRPIARSVTPSPDPFPLVAAEVASAHYRRTGTPSVVRKVASVRDFMADQYRERCERVRLASLLAVVPDPPASRFAANGAFAPPAGSVGQFGYSPTGPDLELVSFPEARTEAPFSVELPDRAGPPVAVFVFATGENALGLVCYQLADRSIQAPPGDHRIIAPIGSGGVVRSFGPAALAVDAFPSHAFIVSLEGIGLSRAAPSEPPSSLDSLASFVPLLLNPASPSDKQAIDLGGSNSRVAIACEKPTAFLRGGLLVLVLPGSVLWLVTVLVRLSRLKARFTRAMAADGSGATPAAAPHFFARDLDGQIESVREAAASERRAGLASEAANARRASLASDLRHLATRFSGDDAETGIAHCALEDGSEEALADAVARLEARMAEIEAREAEVRARERELGREIERITAEFEAIPLDARGEAGEAWRAYTAATGVEDARARLKALKDARKRLPKHFRSGSF